MVPDTGLRKPMTFAARRRLAGSIAPDQTNQLAFAHLERHAAQNVAALDVDDEIADLEHQCPRRLPITVSIKCGSAKNCSGGRSASTRPSDSAMMRWE